MRQHLLLLCSTACALAMLILAFAAMAATAIADPALMAWRDDHAAAFNGAIIGALTLIIAANVARTILSETPKGPSHD